jgi:hypothetical protein
MNCSDLNGLVVCVVVFELVAVLSPRVVLVVIQPC